MSAFNNQNYTTGESWGKLRKAWKNYRIAKVQGDNTKMREWALKIRKIQAELGVSVASFPHLGITDVSDKTPEKILDSKVSITTKDQIKAVIRKHDDSEIGDHECADLLKRLIEKYFRETQ